MTFNSKDLSVLAYANGFTLWQYRSAADNIAAIAGAGYFNAAAPMMRVTDLILVGDSAGSATIRRVSANSGGVVSVSVLA